LGLLTKRSATPLPPLAEPRKTLVGEITTTWARTFSNGIRSFRRNFWPSAPTYAGTTISYELARKLYRNDKKDANLGSGFYRRIVNSVGDFMDLPLAASGDEITDEFLNKCMGVYWRSQLQQMIRDTVRDADTIVRIRRHDPDNALVSAEEWESCFLEVIAPERVAIYYKTGGDAHEIEVAYVRHEIDEVIERATDTGASLRQPQVSQHVIIEEITPSRFRYFDETDGEWRDDLEQPNSWGFVPLVEACNEYDSALEGGQSDLEAPLPFIMAFHDVLSQALTAHKAHSIPKAKFKVNDMLSFIASNWPDSFEQDEMGQPKMETFNGQVSWKGTEVLFMSTEEDVDFLQAQSALGDSKTLLDFLLTCIEITSETPKSVLMAQTAQDADEMIPFAAKINRKRGYFMQPIQMICKMVLVINHMEPIRIPLSWGEITPDIALKKAQALEQEVMSLEVLATREVVSDRTIRETLRPSIPAMKSPQAEAADAKNNVVPPAPATSANAIKGSDSGGAGN
jgi:hypothetical protein